MVTRMITERPTADARRTIAHFANVGVRRAVVFALVGFALALRAEAAEPRARDGGEVARDGGEVARDGATAGASREESARDAAAARAEFELGRAHYLRGAYDEALPHLRRAYVLSNKRPSTIRALAQCERMLGSWDDAIALYREYLSTGPGEAEEAAIERVLAELERSRAEARTTTTRDEADDALSWGAAPDPVPQDRSAPVIELELPTAPGPADAPSLFERPWFWIITGVVVVGSAVALGAALQPADEAPLGGSLGRVLRR